MAGHHPCWYCSSVKLQEIAQKLGEKYTTVRYWNQLLMDAELVAPKKGMGNSYVFNEEDFEKFRQMKEFLHNGAHTTFEAIRMMKESVTPAEALERYKHAQRQIEVLQKKVLQLRKPFWKRLAEWFKKLFSEVLFPRTEQ